MSERMVSIDRILDISSFTTFRGFVVSSSDEEDNVKEVRRSSTAVGSRLNNLFGSIPARAKQETQQDRKKPLFADSVVLYAPGDSGQMEPKGQVGVAILERNQQMLLLIYNSTKQVISNFPLGAGSLSFSLQYGSSSYISISSSTGSVSLLFDESKKDAFSQLTAILMILCEMEHLDVCPGEGEASAIGSHVLLEEKWFRLVDYELQTQERPAQKFKLTGKSDSYLENALGLGKGGFKVVRMAKNAVVQLTVKKIKQAGSNKAESVVSESDTSSLAPPETPQALGTSDVEAEVHSIVENTNDILSRIARVGQPILPGFPVKQTEDVEERHDEVEVPIQIPGPSVPLPAPRSTTDYSTFHTVIGTEMDRLEIRLEAAVQRMIDRAVEPLQIELKQLLLNQEKILERLDQLHSSQ